MKLILHHNKFPSVVFPSTECLGVTYAAEPVCESGDCPVQLELHVVTFTTKSYNEHQGRKKLYQLEREIQTLIKIRHRNLLQIFAVHLSVPNADSNEPTRLNMLMEKMPSLNLEELLKDCERIREERALVTAMKLYSHYFTY